VFKKPMAWRILDSLIGIIMWSIAAGLITHISAM
jgi:arginine exporter protein ArgO